MLLMLCVLYLLCMLYVLYSLYMLYTLLYAVYAARTTHDLTDDGLTVATMRADRRDHGLR